MAEEMTEGQGGQNQGGSEGQHQQGQVGGSGDWREAIPAEFRDAPALKDVKDIGSLAKQFVDQSRFLGNSIRIPGEDAGENGRLEFLSKLQKHAPELIRRPDPSDEKAMAEFWRMAGVPDSEDGYQFDEDLKADEQFLAMVKAQGKKYGIPNKALNAYAKDVMAQEAARAEETKRLMGEEMGKLQQEWGLSTEARIADIKKFSEVMGLPEGFRHALAEGRVGADWMKAIHNIIQQFGGLKEGGEVKFQPGGAIPDGPDEIRAKIRDIENHEGFRKANHPDHQRLIAKRVELFSLLDKQKVSN